MIKSVSCVYLVCDGGEECDPWEEGVPHFTSVEEALECARSYGWVVLGEKTICQEHAAKADCEATGHQYDEWRDREYQGVRYRTRDCDHCCAPDYDPPFDELSLLMHAAREMAAEAGGDRG